MTGLKAVKYYDDPAELPAEWDTYFNDELRQRRFLAHLKRTSGVRHRYFFGEAESGRTVCGILSRQKIYMSRFGLSFFMPATVCALPMPDWTARAFGPEEGMGDVLKVLDDGNKGLLMIAGLVSVSGEFPGWAWKRHLPIVEIDVLWRSMDEYLASFRSSYRRRLRTIMVRGHGLEISPGDPREFDDDSYLLYKQLALEHKHRQAEDEILGMNFFKEMPLDKSFIFARKDGKTKGWVLLAQKGRVLKFLLCGFDKNENEKYHIYKNLLLGIVGHAISGGYRRVDLGQTAEKTKSRMGGTTIERHMLVKHSNLALNSVIANTDIFSYRVDNPPAKLFRKDLGNVA